MIDKATWTGMSPEARDDHLLAALEGVLGQLASIQMQLHDLKAVPAHEQELEHSVSRLREDVETLRSSRQAQTGDADPVAGERGR